MHTYALRDEAFLSSAEGTFKRETLGKFAPAASRAFGGNLRMARRLKGLSQEQFAEITGLSTSFISPVERGLSHPSFPNLLRMASALQVSPHTFFLNLPSIRLE